MILKKLLAETLPYLGSVCSVCSKDFENWKGEDRNRSGRPKELYIAKEQYLLLISLRNRKNPAKT